MEPNHRRWGTRWAWLVAVVLWAGCPGDDDDDTSAGDDDTAPPWSVVADGLHDSEPSRYDAQKKLAMLDGDARLAVFSVGDADHFVGFKHLYAALSLDGGQSWAPPERLTGDELGYISWGAVAAHGDQVVAVAPAGVAQEDPVLPTLYRGTFGGGAVSWAAPEVVGGQPEVVGALFPTVVIDSAGALHLVARIETDYDEQCDVATEDCPQERRHVVYLTDQGGSWDARVISDHWTSTVPELRIDRDGGADGAAGRGRLAAVWQNEDRPGDPFGGVFADVSLWWRDLDSGDEALTSVPGSWLGDDLDSDWKSALLPTLAFDDAGGFHVAYAHVFEERNLFYRYTAEDGAGGWTAPEAVQADDHPLFEGARLVIGAAGSPVLVGTHLGQDGGGAVEAYVRGDDGWGRQELLAADDHGFGWAAPSQEPADDGRYGLLTGRHQAAEGEGVLYHVAY